MVAHLSVETIADESPASLSSVSGSVQASDWLMRKHQGGLALGLVVRVSVFSTTLGRTCSSSLVDDVIAA